MKKIGICAAITGSMTRKETMPGLPVTVDEIINCAYECSVAGAAMIHIHVRDKNERPSLDASLYKEVLTGIREKCDVLVCISTSNHLVGISDKERIRLMELKPDLASIEVTSVKRPDGGIKNSKKFVRDILQAMDVYGVKPEFEIFNPRMLKELMRLSELGLVENNALIQFIIGSTGGMKPDYKNIQWILDSVPKGFTWSAAGIAGMQLPVNFISILNGCDVIRTGMEDNRYFLKGVPVKNNMELVNRAAGMIQMLGCEVANSVDMAKILGVKERNND
ncbi:3-keto-5-aminohexanoate cleavage enzyme [Paenibacillus allorhizoplanae]|uniref:3-keto-5-aminohexanoate cleavage enzyme n=1 Tax=Paenibacillus allorhizoplanae TaxID=2905648 RepID=A0ABM9CAJ4_9BACL|nr:3-keto-5-aminohexanoate cleavage protein [Paenibacillus allorhizoplanae]CAH1208418.1 3-keto-5-aminohexanoate cleavage enzyme [Paenibacillus allorhizoplanae]